MSKLPDRYWDSSTFLAYLNEEEERVDLCQAVLNLAKEGRVRILTSALTLSEVVHVKGYKKMSIEMEELLEAFFEHDYLVLVDLNRSVSELARKLIWRNGLTSYDANHLSTAIHTDVEFIDTWDKRMVKQDGKFHTSEGRPIRIGAPNIPVQGSLDFSG